MDFKIRLLSDLQFSFLSMFLQELGQRPNCSDWTVVQLTSDVEEYVRFISQDKPVDPWGCIFHSFTCRHQQTYQQASFHIELYAGKFNLYANAFFFFP